METAQRDRRTPVFSGESPKIVPVQGADDVDGVFRIHFRAAERPRSAAGAAPLPTADGAAKPQRPAGPPVRLQETRGSLPPSLLQNRA